MTASSIKTIILLLLLSLALHCTFHPLSLCEAAVCYVKPIEPHNATCPGEPCYTLDEYVSNSTGYLVSNTLFRFLNGYHKLSYSLTVSDINNITLRPYIEKSFVIIHSKVAPLQNKIVLKSVSYGIIRGMTLKNIGIAFDNCTNVTLTKLRTENASIVLSNVFGTVSISDLTCTLQQCILLEGTVTQSQNIPNTLIHLNELHVSNVLTGITVKGCIPGMIAVANSTFSCTRSYSQKGHTSGVLIKASSLCSNMVLVCENTLFYTLHRGIYIPHTSQHTRIGIALHNVTFVHMDILAMYLINVHVNISKCHFNNSEFFQSYPYGSILAYNSTLSLMNNVTFIGYKNSFGGGTLALDDNSHILVPTPNNTYVLFENNNALSGVGGAISFLEPFTDETACRIFVEQSVVDKTVFNFTNNWAMGGGNAIYGAHLDHPCYSPNGTLIQKNYQHILRISSFFPPMNFTDYHLQSAISSDVQGLCWCSENETCLTPEQLHSPSTKISVYPGQIFSLSAATFGDMKGFVKSQINTNFQSSGRFEDTLQYHQATGSQRCTKLQYSILSKANVTNIYIRKDFLRHAHFTTIRQVILLKCPLGFSLSIHNKCDCHEYLLHNIRAITCNITEQSIQRQNATWIGVLEKNTSNTTLAYSNVCPFRYCNRSTIKIHITNKSIFDQDVQCDDDRSGVLCGGCRDNFSLALGSNRCLRNCGNNSLLFIIAFATAGIALVFFIKIFNLTVSQGTINGLIFYANIVGAEQSMLFPPRTHIGFLSVFISWLNLNLGIETCFFDGMDAYTKAWLQFVFPVYVWTIALFIIILSHYSIRVSRVFGNNSVPLLATLIILSYSKLLQAVISALSVIELQLLNGSTMAVWERDGNIQYLTGKHIPLFVFAVVVFTLVCFPFTLILISIQWLQRETHCKVLCWVTKLSPFFDAFTGPFKDRHRYWVGALLLARCFLLLIFYIFTANGSAVAFISINFSIIILTVFLAATGSVYRNYYLTILELSYILNLGILANGTLYVQYFSNSRNQDALAMTSVGIAFLQFIATVIYHACVRLRHQLKKSQSLAMVLNQLGKQLKNIFCQKSGQEDTDSIEGSEHEEYEPLDGATYSGQLIERPPFQEIPNFREPLLAYLDD